MWWGGRACGWDRGRACGWAERAAGPSVRPRWGRACGWAERVVGPGPSVRPGRACGPGGAAKRAAGLSVLWGGRACGWGRWAERAPAAASGPFTVCHADGHFQCQFDHKHVVVKPFYTKKRAIFERSRTGSIAATRILLSHTPCVLRRAGPGARAVSDRRARAVRARANSDELSELRRF